MKKEEPLVSVVMPNYNGARSVGEAIQSVIDQTYQNWELLVVDDGSCDDSKTIVDKYASTDPRIKSLDTTFDKVVNGPAAARNTGIKEAKGDYIAFLDSDDMWLTEKLSTQIPFMQEHDAALCYSWYETMNEAGKTVGYCSPHYTKCSYKMMLQENLIGCSTSVYDAKKLGKQYIGMSPDDPFADFSLWLKILKQIDYAWCVQRPLTRYRLVGESISANKLFAAKQFWKILRRVEKLSLPASQYYFCIYALRGVTKKWRYNNG